MPVLVSSPSCGTVLRHLVECTWAKPLRLELETAASLAARGDCTARAPYAGGAPRRCQKSASPQVTSRRPCHSAPHIFWRPTIPIPRGRPLICIKERQSPQAPYPAAMPFTSRRFSGSHASGRPPYPGAAHTRQQSPHVPTPQCGSSHTFAPFPHALRRLPHLSIPWRNSPYKCQIPHRASKLHKIPHRTRRDQRPVHPDPRIKPVHPDFLRRGALRRHHDGVDVMGGHCMLWSGLKAGPGTAARLEAGNCEEGLRVFSRCVPYCRIRPALTVPYFFAASCPRRVCRNPYSIFGLFWILPPF